MIDYVPVRCYLVSPLGVLSNNIESKLLLQSSNLLVFLQHNCTRVRSFLRHRLGRYITNVTRAAEFCSDFLCQGNGRCVRRDPYAHHYLHLSARNFRIRLSGDGGFAVTGWPSQRELQLLPLRFRCHCYEGHKGERCDSINEVREDDGPWMEQDENDEQERRWENKQDKQCEGGQSGASLTGYKLDLVVSVLLLNWLLTTVVRW